MTLFAESTVLNEFSQIANIEPKLTNYWQISRAVVWFVLFQGLKER